MGAKSLIFFVLFLSSQQGFTQATCQEMFSSAPAQSKKVAIFPSDALTIRQYQHAVSSVQRATTREQVIDSIYYMAEMANKLVDTISDNLFIMEDADTPDAVKQVAFDSLSIIANILQQTTGLAPEVLNHAMEVRHFANSQLRDQIMERLAQRATSIGFVYLSELSSQDSEVTVGSNPIGFGDLHSRPEVTDTLETPDQASASNEEEVVERGPLGFGRTEVNTEGYQQTHREAPGFVRFLSRRFSAQDRPTFTLDLSTGFFEVIVNRPPVGFHRP